MSSVSGNSPREYVRARAPHLVGVQREAHGVLARGFPARGRARPDVAVVELRRAVPGERPRSDGRREGALRLWERFCARRDVQAGHWVTFCVLGSHRLRCTVDRDLR